MKKSGKILTGLFIMASVLFTAGCKAAIDDPTKNEPEANGTEEAGQGNSEPLTGTFELSLVVPNQELCNYAEFTVKQNGTALANYNGVPCTISNLADNKVKAVAKSAEGKELAGGTYNIVFNVYTDENKFIEIANYEDSIQIENGAKTTKDYTKETTIVDEADVHTGTIGETGTNTYYIINKKMFITGTGELQLSDAQMYRVECIQSPFNEEIEEIYIADGITVIGESVFYKTNVKKVFGCKDVTVIADNGFKSCKSLTEIPAFANVTTIGNEAFYYCKALKELPAFEKVTIIGNEAFSHCTFTEINGFNAVIEIGASAFTSCESLVSVSGFASLNKIMAAAFIYCTNLSSFNFASNSYEIGPSVFEYCTGFTEIVIPASVSQIGFEVFYNNNATSITILNRNITIPTTDCNHFISSTGDFAGTFNFAGSLDDWKKVLGWNGTDTDWNDMVNENGNYKQALSRIGLDKNITINFNYTVPATN